MDELLWSQCDEPLALLAAAPVDPSPRKRRLLIAACIGVAGSELPVRIRHLGKLLMLLADAAGKKRDSLHMRLVLAVRRVRESPRLLPGSEYEEWVAAIRGAMTDDDRVAPAPPLVAGLMEQGMSAGAGLAFMVAGAVSSVPAMAAVWALVKHDVFAAYMGLGFAGAVLAGFLFQLVM